MQYAKKNYPKVYKNINDFAKEYQSTLPIEKVDKFKDLLKRYQSIKETAEKSNDTTDHDELLRFSHELSKGKLLMQFTYKNYPNVYKNIYARSQEHIAKTQSREKNQDHDIER